MSKHQLFFAVLTLSLLIGHTCFGQEENSSFRNHEFSLVGGVGLTGLDIELTQGETYQKAGPVLGVGYTYFLSPNWGIGIGAEYQKFSAAASLENYSDSYETTDSEGESFEFRYNAGKFNQQYDISMVGIPITVHYQRGGETKWYVRAGAKIGLPMNATYQTNVNDLSTSGYYPQYNAELFDPAFMGFGEFERLEAPEQDLETKMAFAAVLETGIKQALGDRSSIYIGLFMDYGLNDINDTSAEQEQLVNYQTGQPDTFAYTNLLETNITQEIKPRVFGVKLRLAF